MLLHLCMRDIQDFWLGIGFGGPTGKTLCRWMFPKLQPATWVKGVATNLKGVALEMKPKLGILASSKLWKTPKGSKHAE